jgi:hypothetical protein
MPAVGADVLASFPQVGHLATRQVEQLQQHIVLFYTMMNSSV